MSNTISKTTIEAYEKIAPFYAAKHSNPVFWKEEFDAFKKMIKGKKVIDIGCGHGRDAGLFLEAQFNYTGIDASKNLLSIAKKNHPRANFILMDFYHLKFPPESFDGFWAAALLLHVPKSRIANVLKDLKNILKKEGAAFISVKEKRNISEGMIKEDKYGGIKRYFAFYDKKEFKRILEDVGFKVLKIHKKREPDGDVWLCYFVKK